jgi:hypothetical protein
MPFANRLSWLIAAAPTKPSRALGRVAKRSGRLIRMLSPSVGGFAQGLAAKLKAPLTQVNACS